MKYAQLLMASLILLGASLWWSPSVLAQTDKSDQLSEACGGEGRYLLGIIPSWDRGLGDCEDIDLAEVLEGNKVAILITNALTIVVTVSALVAVGFVIGGGFMYILSSGEPDKVTTARKTIINALIGLVIVLMGRVVAEIVYNQLTTF